MIIIRLVVEKSIELSYNNFVSDPSMKTNNIALIIFFAFKESRTQFCVADTHLNYKDVNTTLSQVSADPKIIFINFIIDVLTVLLGYYATHHSH